mmetsp:Transcript_69264/g.200660  ORF Transcript_69264/g.200660 Transcript_69264/m.200660 type:complete len:205 (+) Transcript_69264:335-949(+)
MQWLLVFTQPGHATSCRRRRRQHGRLLSLAANCDDRRSLAALASLGATTARGAAFAALRPALRRRATFRAWPALARRAIRRHPLAARRHPVARTLRARAALAWRHPLALGAWTSSLRARHPLALRTGATLRAGPALACTLRVGPALAGRAALRSHAQAALIALAFAFVVVAGLPCGCTLQSAEVCLGVGEPAQESSIVDQSVGI